VVLASASYCARRQVRFARPRLIYSVHIPEPVPEEQHLVDLRRANPERVPADIGVRALEHAMLEPSRSHTLAARFRPTRGSRAAAGPADSGKAVLAEVEEAQRGAH